MVLEDYEILTEHGFKPFKGVKKAKVKSTLQIKCGDFDLECTPNHLIMLPNKTFVPACSLKVGDIVYPNRVITYIERLFYKVDVYDVIGVEDTSSYFTNGFISHNCAIS